MLNRVFKKRSYYISYRPKASVILIYMFNMLTVTKLRCKELVFIINKYTRTPVHHILGTVRSKRLWKLWTHLSYSLKGRAFGLYLLLLIAIYFNFFIHYHGNLDDFEVSLLSSKKNERLKELSKQSKMRVDVHFYFLSDSYSQKKKTDEHVISDMTGFNVTKNKLSCKQSVLQPQSLTSTFSVDHASNITRSRFRLNCNFLMQPMVNSIVEIAEKSNASVVIISESDLSLKPDFLKSIRNIYKEFGHFFFFGKACSGQGRSSILNRNTQTICPLCFYCQMLKHCNHDENNASFWVWSTKGPPLFDEPMPHFVYGHGSYEKWMVEHVGPSRMVLLANKFCSIPLKFTDTQDDRPKSSGEYDWLSLKYQEDINLLLNHITAPPRNGASVVSRVSACNDNRNCFSFDVFRRRHTASANQTVRIKVERCGSLCNFSTARRGHKVYSGEDRYILKDAITHFNESPWAAFPEIAKKQSRNNSIIVTGLNYGHREMMMNWVCNLRMLGISNFLVIAFDEMLYMFAILRGIPCYLESSFQSKAEIQKSSAVYGTAEFKALTKSKSRAVYRLISNGFNVLWSDSDVIIFKNPLQFMASFKADIVIQSNAPDDSEPNGIRRINSGFYFVRSTPDSVRVFAEMIQFCAKSPTTEQGCFYDIMCGEDGRYRVGREQCVYSGFTLSVLGRSFFPNGLTHGIWNSTPGSILKTWPMLYVLHNNWVRGLAKTERLAYHGLEFYNFETELCQEPRHFRATAARDENP